MNVNNIIQPTNEKLESLKANKANNNKIENYKSEVKFTVGGSLGMGAFMGGVTAYTLAEGGSTLINSLKVGGGVATGAALLFGAMMTFGFAGGGIISDKSGIKGQENYI